MINLNKHIYRCGPSQNYDLTDEDVQDPKPLRRHIEPWLTAVFQSEHLSLLLGSGFTCGLAAAAGGTSANMAKCTWASELKEEIDAYAEQSAKACGRGVANIEDELRAALQLLAGLEVLRDSRADALRAEIDRQLKCFMDSVLESERSVACSASKHEADDLLVSFLLSFASRTATRERLNLLTTNYDRLIEYGCDLAGLHVIDRFVGAQSPVFRSTRLNIDIHYNPPGIRGEPRYLEGVVRFSKIHGSLDWRWEGHELKRYGLSLGADPGHPDIPKEPSESVMIYPNAAKDVETLAYPYAELFRDFAATVCRPNSSLVTYGYGFGDDHVNRIITDMLTIPSTHLVIIAWDQTDPTKPDAVENGSRKRIIEFLKRAGKKAQISLLLGSHFGDLEALVENYLPKPAIDPITMRRAKLMEDRGKDYNGSVGEGSDEQTD
jgi:hypothetical protein